MLHDERTTNSEQILQTVRRTWGYSSLRPLQSEAIEAAVQRRDSLVVLPTGGGKSLCYQVPPLVADRTDVVVSPLISLMKDQVDGLVAAGYPAAALHSGLSPQQRQDVRRGLNEGRYRLVFVAPERLVTEGFLSWAQRAGVQSFAIDEAHCISHWGHDFRPEYRQLSVLHERLGSVSLHAFTATATPRVRQDILEQLGLVDPVVLVGTFDRPNLLFRVLPRIDVQQQTLDVLGRHPREAAIVYCISRKDTETMAAWLLGHGIRAAHYHAGLEPAARRDTQEAFAREDLDVVVATVAFGMGIDRSNVRCVIHAAMPKSIEHYQQEAGRAGRDGLEAECVLLYSAADFIRWKSLLERRARDAAQEPDAIEPQVRLLNQMARFCSAAICRHRALANYFGQEYAGDSCGACDVCRGEIEGVADSTLIAQKILSCVARTGQRFGVGHVVNVLVGADTDQIRRLGHGDLSTHGLLGDVSRKELTNYVYQLVDQDLLGRTDGDRPVLHLKAQSLEVLRGDREAVLIRPRERAARRTRVEAQSWEGVDRGLFERLREVRLEQARAQNVPAYVVFGDATLRDLARRRPGTLSNLRLVHGLGERRCAQFGRLLLDAIRDYCRNHDLDVDPGEAPHAVR